MEDLIPIVNKLQDLASTTGDLNVKIPQIIVVGEQSSGKSSVLESLIGRPILPRGTGIVTRCPIVLQLHHLPTNEKQETKVTHHDEGGQEDQWKKTARSFTNVLKQGFQQAEQDAKSNLLLPPSAEIVGESDPSEWCVFLHRAGQKFSDFEAAREEMQNEVNRRAGTNKGIVRDELSMKIHSPNVINLTLVDLPGIVKNPVGDQPEDIELQVRTLLLNYMKNENSIILAVCAATSDLVTSEAIKMTKEVDPEGERTIVVITKLDLMDQGTDATDVLTQGILQFKLGIVGVVNRSQADITNKKSIEQSLRDEERFLNRKYPALADSNGTPFLAITLQRLLMEHIRKCLPRLQSWVTSSIIRTQNELENYGTAATPEDKSEALLTTIHQFCETFLTAISVTEGGKIREIFEDTLPREVDCIDPSINLTDRAILEKLDDHEGIQCFDFLPKNAFFILAKEQITLLREPALNFAESCYTQIQNLAQSSGVKLLDKRFPKLTSAIHKEVLKLLTERHEEARNTLTKYVRVRGSFIVTRNIDFTQEVQNLLAELRQSKAHTIQITGTSSVPVSRPEQCAIVKKLVSRYFKIVKDGFKEYCQQAIVEDTINYLEKNLRRILTSKLHVPDVIDGLLQESPVITKKREAAKRRVEEYKKANEILGEIRDVEI